MQLTIKENELGDRMILGLPYAQGGAISGASNLDTFNSPSVTQDLNKFGTSTGVIHTSNPLDYVKDVQQIKYKVTPDEVIAGIDYELKKMVFKDKKIAKQNVTLNLKTDPQYYSKLHMLDISDGDDKAVDVKETIDYRTPQEKEISKIMEDLYQKKLQRRNWS